VASPAITATLAPPFRNAGTIDNGTSSHASTLWAAWRWLAPHLIDDVRGDLLLALSEGRIGPRDLPTAIAKYKKQNNAKFSKYVPVVGGFMHSLDQQVYDDGSTRLIDTVTRGLWD
jgi:hypothetical protein